MPPRQSRDWAASPYSRLYHSLPGDPKFADIFDNDAALAAYVRMLLVADQSYPHAGQVPAGCRPAAVKLLVSKGIVTMVGKNRFFIVALVKEREARSEQGKRAAQSRWDADAMHQHRLSNASAMPRASNADGMLVRERVRERGARVPVKQVRVNGDTSQTSHRARAPQKIGETTALRNVETIVSQMQAKKS